MSSASIALAMPLHRSSAYLAEALESLAGQTLTPHRLVLVDEGVDPRTGEIARAFAERHDFAEYHRNSSPAGLVGNWKRAVQLSLREPGAVRYFAWVGDHDRWHAEWLERLFAQLENHPEAALAYPHCAAISETGAELRWRPRDFETRGVSDAEARMTSTMRGISAGWAVYGLFRADILQRCGGFRRVILPDRMLAAELSLYGEIHQVPETLWFRRFRGGEVSSHQRQRRTLFGRHAPWHAYLPWWLVQSAAIGWQLGIAGSGKPEIERRAAPRIAMRYLVASWLYGSNDQGLLRWARTRRKHLRRQLKQLRPRALRPGVHTLAVALGARRIRRALRLVAGGRGPAE